MASLTPTVLKRSIFLGMMMKYLKTVVDMNAMRARMRMRMRMIGVIVLIVMITFPKPRSFKERIVNLAPEKCQSKVGILSSAIRLSFHHILILLQNFHAHIDLLSSCHSLPKLKVIPFGCSLPQNSRLMTGFLGL